MLLSHCITNPLDISSPLAACVASMVPLVAIGGIFSFLRDLLTSEQELEQRKRQTEEEQRKQQAEMQRLAQERQLRIAEERANQEALERTQKLQLQAQAAAAELATQKKEEARRQAEAAKREKVASARRAVWQEWAEIGDYAEQLPTVAGAPPQFWKLYEHHVEATRHYGRSVTHTLGRGVDILQDADQLSRYFGAYGGHHYHKLDACYNHLWSSNLKQQLAAPLTVLDYGCGQALATTMLLDYAARKQHGTLTLTQVVLIEPSEAALRRGILHLQLFLPTGHTTELRVRPKKLGDLLDSDLTSEAEHVKIHLFSNILDVPAINLSALAKLIQRTQRGLNIFVCTSPFAEGRLRAFAEYFHRELPIWEHTGEFSPETFNHYSNSWGNSRAVQSTNRIFAVNL